MTPLSLRAAISAALARPGAPRQVDLARAAGIAPENLSAWLKGRRPIPVRAIEAMLAALDIEPELRAELAALRETLRGAEARVREILG